MLIPHVSNAIAVWKTLEGPHLSFNNATLYAVKDGNKTSFYLEQDERVSHFVMRNVVGWIEHQTLGTNQQSVYRRFYPFIDMEGSTVIFAVFIKSVSSEMPGKVVAFFQNRKFVVLFFPQKQPPFFIKQIPHGYEPTYHNFLQNHWKEYHAIKAYPMSLTIMDNTLQFESLSHMQNLACGFFEVLQRISDYTYSINEGLPLEVVPDPCCWAGGLDPLIFNSLEHEILLNLYTVPIYQMSRFHSGLYLKQTCNNKNCTVYEKIRWIQKGIGHFEMIEMANTAKCPECFQIASDVNNVGFVDCFYSIQGETNHGKVVKRCNREAPKDRFLTFADDGTVPFAWRTLDICTFSEHW